MERGGQFTKTGFSRRFGCCGHHRYCNLGKEVCFYAKTDPDVMKGCSAWRRHHGYGHVPSSPQPEPVIKKQAKKMEQMTLF